MIMPTDYCVWGAMLERYQTHAKAEQHHAELKDYFVDRMISFTSSLIMQLLHFTTEFDGLLMQLLGNDIVNTQFKYRASYRQLIFII